MQANRKDLQRFLGLNDDNEMVRFTCDEICTSTIISNRSTFEMYESRKSRSQEAEEMSLIKRKDSGIYQVKFLECYFTTTKN